MNSTPHPSIDWSSPNLKSARKRFRQHCERLFSGPLEGKSQAVKYSYLMIWVREKGREIFSTWVLTAEETNKTVVYLVKFRAHVEPISNPIVTRFTFHKRDHGNENIKQYVTELKFVPKEGEFDSSSDDIIRHKLFQSQKQQNPKPFDLPLNQCRKPKHRYQQPSNIHHRGEKIDALKRNHNNQDCYFCGAPNYLKNHKCPARGRTCSKCNKLNHFAKVCKSKVINEISQQGAKANASKFMIDAVNSLQTQHLDGPNAIMRAVDQNLNLAFKTNTRAEANVLPTSDYRCMIPTLQLQTTRDVLTIYTGEKLEGTCISHLRINYKDRGKPDTSILFGEY